MGERAAFFYGTLMAREILFRVIYGSTHLDHNPAAAILASQLTITPAILHNFCRHRVLDADYPGIIPEAGSSVQGTYVTGLTDGDIYRLDQFEGSQYTMVDVEVRILKDGVEGETKSGQTYVFTAGSDNLEKKEWDYEAFRRDKLKNWTGDSEEYNDVDEPVGGCAGS